MSRATSLSPPERFLLEAWGAALAKAFATSPLLVGSVARAEPWRDVDVRLVLPDVVFAALTGEEPDQLAALNVAFSLWGQRATGLPIDFQFQDRTTANAEHNGRRIPLGINYARGDR